MAILVAGTGEVTWPSEVIPPDDELYMRIHRTYYLNPPLPYSEIPPGAFREQQGAMSTDWSKYSTPEQTRNRCESPEDNAVIALTVRDVEAIAGLSVRHTPDWPRGNRAHTDVQGIKAGDRSEVTRRRLALARKAGSPRIELEPL